MSLSTTLNQGQTFAPGSTTNLWWHFTRVNSTTSGPVILGSCVSMGIRSNEYNINYTSSKNICFICAVSECLQYPDFSCVVLYRSVQKILQRNFIYLLLGHMVWKLNPLQPIHLGRNQRLRWVSRTSQLYKWILERFSSVLELLGSTGVSTPHFSIWPPTSFAWPSSKPQPKKVLSRSFLTI